MALVPQQGEPCTLPPLFPRFTRCVLSSRNSLMSLSMKMRQCRDSVVLRYTSFKYKLFPRDEPIWSPLSLSLCQANKMCSFLDLLDFSKMHQEKKTCMWKGKLSPQTCVLVHLFKESNLEPCTEAMFPMTLRSSMVTFISNQVLHQLAS